MTQLTLPIILRYQIKISTLRYPVIRVPIYLGTFPAFSVGVVGVAGVGAEEGVEFIGATTAGAAVIFFTFLTPISSGPIRLRFLGMKL